MLTFPYRFAVALFRKDGSYLGSVPAQIDWQPVLEWARFHFQRLGELPLDDGKGSASVLPLWEHTVGEPYCRGYRVEIERERQRPVNAEFPTTHFAAIASAAASVYVERQLLREGESYTYVLVAHLAPEERPEPGGLAVTNASPRLPVRDAPLGSLQDRSKPAGVIDYADMPVFVSSQVLREMAGETAAKRGIETGGILIGNLLRDRLAGEIFAEVTAQIPAEHTSGTQVKLSFTAQTWAAAEAALRLRGRGEIYLGYWHSHPVRSWCQARECSLEKQKTCRLAKDFFSADDEAVMRAAFPRAYNIAIVANDTAFTDLTFSMFGNREGLLQPRGYCILED